MAYRTLQILFLALIVLGIPKNADAQIFKKKKTKAEQREVDSSLNKRLRLVELP